MALVGAGLLGTHVWQSWPDVPRLAIENPARVSWVERNRATLGSDAIAWRWVPLREISPHLLRAVVVAEDIEFYDHRGFSWFEIRSAWREARAGGRARGASTITQQLAKNLWLTPDRTAWRKLREAILTVEIERHLSKRRILELYVNVVEFGPGVFGAAAAAERYFGKAPLFLTEAESAYLAAALSRPSLWHPGGPGTGSDPYRARVEMIRRRMGNAEFLWQHVLWW
ncbi:MAG: transglycosylase domain-containing protein [Gemmatimonadota bacterium]|nr:transglycosylase domain-containing protein [Gemmatimonadota bacterium]